MLQAAGADLTVRDSRGGSILLHCLQHEAVLKHLLSDSTVDVNALTDEGHSVLYAQQCSIWRLL
jgi:hypothetical protein